jgi:hypothetical protein
MDLNKLPKDLLIKLISEVNDISNMSIEELEKKQEEIESGIRLKKIKRGLLNFKKNKKYADMLNFEKIKLLEKVEYSNGLLEFYIEGKIFSCERLDCFDVCYEGNLFDLIPVKNIIVDIFNYFKFKETSAWMVCELEYENCEKCGINEYQYKFSNIYNLQEYNYSRLHTKKDPFYKYCDTCKGMYCEKHCEHFEDNLK